MIIPLCSLVVFFNKTFISWNFLIHPKTACVIELCSQFFMHSWRRRRCGHGHDHRLGAVRYDFPGKAIMDGIIEPFALPTAVAGIALTHLTTTEGWVGAIFSGLGSRSPIQDLELSWRWCLWNPFLWYARCSRFWKNRYPV